MGTFVIASRETYSFDGTTFTANGAEVSTIPGAGFLETAGNINNTFTPNEDLDYSSDPGGFGGNYVGHLTINGTPYICIESQESSDYYLFTKTSLGAANFPASFASADLNTGNLAFCFMAGTMIATPDGDVPVQDLRMGDVVSCADGSTTPVKWMGQQTVHKVLAGAHMQPVRMRAGALGGGLPKMDLVVTADHGMIIDDYVINASALVNGTNIDFVPLSELPEQVVYYHIETAEHDVVLANGAAAETFVDAVGRAAFDNYSEYLDLYGVDRVIPEMPRLRISSQRFLPQAIKARLGIADFASGRGQLRAS